MSIRRRRSPSPPPAAAPPPPPPAPTKRDARAARHHRATAALAVAALAAAVSWWAAGSSPAGGWRGSANVDVAPPSVVSPADAAAAADELAAAAAPSLNTGASGYVGAGELEGAGFNETEFRARAAAAVGGAFVADAATLGLHGVPPSKIQRLLADAGRTGEPEFWTPLAGPYEADPGSFSAHGYEVLPLLQSLLGANNFSAPHYAAAAAAFFASTPAHVEPLPTAWLPAAAAALAEGRSAARLGLASPAASAVVKVPTIVARFGATPHLRRALAGAVRVHQTDPSALAAAGAAAAVLERVLVLGEPLPAAVAAASECAALSGAGRAMLAAGLARAAGRGAAAAAPPPPHPHGATAEHALATALDAALAQPTDYVAAVRASIVAGGDAAAARAHLVGAWLGAATGPPSPAWRKRATKAVSVDAMVHLLLHQRGQAVPVAMPGQAVEGEEVGRV